MEPAGLHAPKKRGRKSADEIGGHLLWTLRNLQELDLLETCHIARLTSVRRLAETSYIDSLFPSGMAIRKLILEAIEIVCKDLGNIPAYNRECKFLNGVAGGSSVAEISRDLGLSREHVVRTVQQRAMKLLNRAFQAQTKEVE